MDRAPCESGLAQDRQRTDGTLVSRSRELDGVRPGSALRASDRPGVSWAARDGPELAGWGVATRFVASGPDRFRRIRAAADRRFDALDHEGPAAARPRAAGGFSFHDELDSDREDVWRGFDAAAFVIPRVQVVRTDGRTYLTVTGDDGSDVDEELDRWAPQVADAPGADEAGPLPAIVSSSRSTGRDEWTAQVEDALERIDRGDLEKVVLAQSLSAELDTSIDVPDALDRLNRRYPDCYRFAVDRPAGGTFLGAPPERLVKRVDGTVETEALAGSVPRGETTAADAAHAERMLASEKAQREHGLVVEAIRDQLAPLADDVRTREQTVRRLATIQHLRTPIEAELDPGSHVLELVEALHPTPAVGGVPQEAACDTIRDLETFDRGWYAGPVGWFDGDGDGEFAVAIRSGVATDGAITCFGGNGIVADSDPDEEWEEVQLKLEAVLDELG